MSKQFIEAWNKYAQTVDDSPSLDSLYEQGWKDFQKEAIKILEKYDSRDWLNFIRAL